MKSRKMIRSKSFKRFLALALAFGLGMLLLGCASSAADREGGSSIPWNRPEPGDSASPLGFMPDQS